MKNKDENIKLQTLIYHFK